MKEEILEYFKDINHAYNDCTRFDTLKRMLGELEQESRTDWIPVSERLPEEDKTGCSNWHSVKVFAQIKSNINDVWETEIVKGYFIEFDNEIAFSLEEFPLCIPDGWDFITLDKDNRAYDEEYSERYVELQAWMPLPEPYKEEGGET